MRPIVMYKESTLIELAKRDTEKSMDHLGGTQEQEDHG